MIIDLKTDQGLAGAVRTAQARYEADYVGWQQRVAEFIAWVEGLDRDGRADEAFQRALWDDNPISAVGMGRIDVSAAVADPAFRDWLAEQSVQPLPADQDTRVRHLENIYAGLQERLRRYCRRQPHLKIFRVLAALFPDDLTCMVDMGKAERLARALLGARHGAVERHLLIRRRLDQVLGPPSADLQGKAERMRLPWLLYRLDSEDDDEPITVDSRLPGGERLLPLPAARRRKSLTALSGGLSHVLACLEAARDGLIREDLH